VGGVGGPLGPPGGLSIGSGKNYCAHPLQKEPNMFSCATVTKWFLLYSQRAAKDISLKMET